MTLVSRVFLGIGLAVAATDLPAQQTSPERPTVVVLSLDVRGYTRDMPALRRAAEGLTEALRRALAADSSIHWLPDRPEGSRGAGTSQPPAAHHVVVGSVQERGPEVKLLIWQIVMTGDGRILVTDTLEVRQGGVADAATGAAGRISRVVRRLPGGP